MAKPNNQMDPLVPEDHRASPSEVIASNHPPYSDGMSGDDAALLRASTLLMDTPPRDSEEMAHRPSMANLKYVQGIIHNQKAYLITNLLNGESRSLVQPQMVWTMGRNRSAAIPLQDRAMSRRHAVILYVQDLGFQLIDLNSMNGSFVNGVKIHHRQLLLDGDMIRVGSTAFIFFCSRTCHSVEAIHPEVLARFNDLQARSDNFIDYAALEEPEVVFRTTKS